MHKNRINAAARCDTGIVRPINQDQVYYSLDPVGYLPNLFVVADGMGGHRAGDLASSEALRYFREYIEDHSKEEDDIIVLMKTALQMANRYIYYLSEESPAYRGMGTTFVAVTVCGNYLYCINVGDSRMYRLKQSEETPLTLDRVTIDHSVVEMLLRSGAITEEEARVHPQKNMVTRAIGIDETVEIDDYVIETSDLKRILLCSDGLSNMLPDLEILKELSAEKSVEETADRLVDRANEAGGKDNISVVVIEFAGEDEIDA
ncbi:MAG: Stp1/IreP family PP2C-type Ser/Thr phosphatase [Firmicutes bacterium]|nr:Stp1/IreP family PP2C-type Ser/Thr phosphatase [Bacillota bacterium]